MFKKISLLVAVLCLVVFTFAGCSNNYDSDIKALKDRIDKLEQENQTLKSGLDSVTGFINGSGEVKIYQLGDTVDVVQNGIKQFSIKYERKETNSIYIKFTNYNLAGFSPNAFSAMRYNSTTKATSIVVLPDNVLPMDTSNTFSVTISSYDYIYFGFPSGLSYNSLFAIFKV